MTASSPSVDGRLLFVADVAVAGADELPPQARAAIDAAAHVYVLTPTLPGRLAWLATDVELVYHAQRPTTIIYRPDVQAVGG